MCLITTQQTPFIAEQNIVVYKQLRKINGQLMAEYHNTIYELDVLYKTDIEKIDRDNGGIFDIVFCDWVDSGYWNDKGIELTNIIINPKIYNCFGQGFHSYNTVERTGNRTDFLHRVLCIIPKGGKYYENPTGLRVSNQIIIKQVIS